jgi:hypothetical protein
MLQHQIQMGPGVWRAAATTFLVSVYIMNRESWDNHINLEASGNLIRLQGAYVLSTK